MPTLGRQRQVELYKFEAGLWDPVLAYTYSLKWKLRESHVQKDDSCLKPRQSLGNRVSEAPGLLWGLRKKLEGAPLGPQEVVWWVSCLGIRLAAISNPGKDIYTDVWAQLWSPKSSYIDVVALTNSEDSCIWRQNLYRSKWGPVSITHRPRLQMNCFLRKMTWGEVGSCAALQCWDPNPGPHEH